jgi:hypothetical protein
MIIICGKTIAEVERDLEMAKQAIASGMPYGVGGATIADAEKGVEMMRSMMGGAVAPISNPNYTASECCGCCNDYCDGYCEDEDEDTCPECGATYDEGWCGDYCECCGYGCEDEEAEDEYVENIIASAERLGIPKNAIHAWIDAWTN